MNTQLLLALGLAVGVGVVVVALLLRGRRQAPPARAVTPPAKAPAPVTDAAPARQADPAPGRPAGPAPDGLGPAVALRHKPPQLARPGNGRSAWPHAAVLALRHLRLGLLR